MRYIRRNHSTSLGSVHVCVDCESVVETSSGRKRQQTHSLRCGYATHFRIDKDKPTRRDNLAFDTQDEFWDWLIRKMHPKHPITVWAHHISFDLTMLKFWDRLVSGDFSILEPEWRWQVRIDKSGKAYRRRGLAVTDDPPIILKVWHRSGCQVTFLDTLNFWRAGIREMCEGLGISEYQMPENNAPDWYWREKAMKDCLAVEKSLTALLAFIREHDLGKLRYTAPAQAMAAYRHRFMDTAILTHDVPHVRDLERRAYLGGECEPYFIGTIMANGSKRGMEEKFRGADGILVTPGYIYHVDCNSLYPYMMKGWQYPCKLEAYARNPTKQDIDTAIPRLGVVARCTVHTTHEPIARKDKGETIRYLGTFDTYLCGHEFVRHWTQGKIVKVHEAAFYRLDYLFSRYVTELYGLRVKYATEGRQMHANLCKLLMCSLYGKFAQRQPQWEDTGEVSASEFGYEYEADDTDEKAVRTFRSVGYQLQRMLKREEKEGSFIAISAFVTAAGREYMREIRQVASEKNVYYQGVDSLLLNEAGYQHLCNYGCINDNQLGNFKLKGRHLVCTIMGSNYYVLDGDITRAGLSEKAVLGRDGKFRQYNADSLNTMIASGRLGYVHASEVAIPTEQAFTRGIIQPDGRVKPLVYCGI